MKLVMVSIRGGDVKLITSKWNKDYKDMTVAQLGKLVNKLKDDGYTVDMEVLR